MGRAAWLRRPSSFSEGEDGGEVCVLFDGHVLIEGGRVNAISLGGGDGDGGEGVGALSGRERGRDGGRRGGHVSVVG